jgi:cyclic pyranopterin phosphate synthase
MRRSSAGLDVKINTVALKGDNAGELLEWCAGPTDAAWRLSLIETMPLGEIEADRTDQYLPLSEVRAAFDAEWTLTPMTLRTAGPARYVRVEETGGVLGFITPMSHSFCEACNRVRVTCTGDLVLCLGREDGAALRPVLRARPEDDAPLREAIRAAILDKPGA